MIDYARRIHAARARMAQENIGLIYLPYGANLFYLTGVCRRELQGTDNNAYGDWAAGAFIGLDGGIVLTVPRMRAGFFKSEIRDKPWYEPARLIMEAEDPLDVLAEVLRRFDLRGKTVALDDHAWAQTAYAFRRLLPEAGYVLASKLLAPMRMIKEEVELDLMRKAGEITDAVFKKAIARLKPGVTELDIASEIDYQFKRMGAEYTSFPTGIIFDGPEHMPPGGGNPLAPGNSVTFDFGGVYQGYCSDFGRTAFVGEPPKEFVAVHELILHSQAEAIKAMRAGQIAGSDADRIARRPIEEAGYGPNFTHRLGHGIGVTVHEPPWLDVVEHTVLQANMTFTVEPSIRIAGRFSDRVEDVVLVTPAGGVSLYNTDHRIYVVD